MSTGHDLDTTSLALVYEGVSDPIFLLSVGAGEIYRFASVNEAFLTVTGLRREQVVSHRIEEVLPKSSHALVLGHYRTAIQENRTVRWEEVAVFPLGKRVGLVTVTPLRDASRSTSRLIGWVRDITEERRILDELHTRERDLSITLSSIGDAVIAAGVDGRIVRLNPAAEALTGWPAAEAVGRPLEEVVCILDEENRARVGDPVRRVLRDGAVVGVAEHEVVVARDGTERPVADRGAPIRDEGGAVQGVVLVFRDRTEEAHVERALRQREEMFRGLLDAAPDGIVIVGEGGIIRIVNAQTQRLFGYDRAELVGKAVEVLLPERFRGRHVAHVRGFLAAPWARPMGAGLDLYGLRKDGSEFSLEIALSPMESTEGPVVIAAIRDVTERKRAEEVRARNLVLELENRRALEASRLKSEFLAHMSHELRTPLNAIIGFAEVLHEGQVDPSSAQHKEFLGDILTSGRHLLQLINDVLDLSKVEAGRMEFKPEEVDIKKIVGEVCAILRSAAATKRIQVEVDVGPGLDAVVDPARLKQVLYNYLSNALKFTPEGGRVTIRARSEDPDRLRIEVEDTGVGIAPADLPRLFSEFVQIDRAQGGTGLGLALTRRLVEAQGGTVGARSEPGKGSVFEAVLPRRASPARARQEKTVFPGHLAERPTVLVVDDDPADRALLVETLQSAGYAVETVGTGAEAIGRCRARAFDAVTLDLLLPDMGGLDVLAALRTEGASRDAVVIIVTVVAEARTAGGFAVHDVLVKPLEPSSLVRSLHRAGLDPEGRGRVLVVDDDPSVLKLMALALEQQGYSPVCRSDGESGLAAAAQARPVAVVLDLLMPGMDGFEFLDRVRAMAEHRTTPVIVWTNKELTRDEIERLRAGAQGLVLKKAGGTAAVVRELEAFLPVKVGEAQQPRGHQER